MNLTVLFFLLLFLNYKSCILFCSKAKTSIKVKNINSLNNVYYPLASPIM